MLNSIRVSSTKKAVLSLLVILIISSYGCSKPTPTPQQQVPPQTQVTPITQLTYTSDIQPILSKNCVGCHNPNGTVAKIPLDTYTNVMNYVKPKAPIDSKLIQSVDGGTMSDKLSKDELQLLKNWVTQGAQK